MKNWFRFSMLIVVTGAFVACSSPSAEAENEDEDTSAVENQTEDTSVAEESPECPTSAEEPVGLMLTWQTDPTTTMTIDWHTEPDDEARPTLCFKTSGNEEWDAEVDAEQIEFAVGENLIQRVELTGLQPGTEYEFQVGEFARSYRFRTMPADIDDQPVVFATGGDTQHNPHFLEATNRAVLEYDLDFVAFGGDIAYADGGTGIFHLERWGLWFTANMNTLIEEDGRVIPILAGLGNHEVVSGYYFNHDEYEQTDEWRVEIAPYFYSFFAFPGQPGYGALDFGDYMTLAILDTDHSNPIEGEQTQWLETTLRERNEAGVPHIFPIYHVPAYPSHRSFDGEGETRVRETWVPLFEAHGVQMAFENHDHTYKRTHPVRGGEIDEEEGIIYLGDGAWGVTTRDGDQKDAWYIDQFASVRHGIIVTIEGDERHVRVVNSSGETIDEVGEPLP